MRSGSGEERDLEVGSRVRGREVKVSRGSVVILGGVGTGTGCSVAVLLSVPDCLLLCKVARWFLNPRAA